MRNKFITIEGIEGAGKTTALKVIQDYLIEKQKDFVLTREPGGTLVAEQIRKILLVPRDEIISPDTELLLMFACRAQHMTNVILPALQADKWVISDRFVDASYAYQGGGRQMDMKKIETLDQWIVGDVKPCLTFLFDISPEVGLNRVKHRGSHDRIEQEKIEFFERVRDIYLKRADQFPDRFCVLDSNQSLETIQHELKKKLNELF